MIHRYTLEYKDGQCHGQAFDAQDTLVYEGAFMLTHPPARHGVGTSYVGGAVSYHGEWNYDRPGGFGTEYCTRQGEKRVVYRGEWKDGQRHGHGSYFGGMDVVQYNGEFEDGCRHGQGREHDAAGNLAYEGEWRNGMRHGMGTSYRSSMREDSGGVQFCHVNSLEYSGEWKDDEYDGQGKSYAERSERLLYDGGWVKGKFDGVGRFYHDTESHALAYTGGYKEGMRSGAGTSFAVDGTLHYKGDWKQDRFDGRGELWHGNGNLRYKGDFREQCFHGDGTLYEEDGTLVYKGAFLNGSYDGKGEFYTPGIGLPCLLFRGTFEVHRFKRGEMFRSDGTLEYYGQMKTFSKDEFALALRDGDVRLGRMFEELPYDDFEFPCIVADGRGTWYAPDGATYTGHFKEGLRHGREGVEYEEDGVLVYKGAWDRDRRHGWGESYDGEHRYHGAFKDGAYHGMGKQYRKKTGVLVYEGEWEEGRKVGLCLAGRPRVGVYTEDKYDAEATRKRVRELVDARASKAPRDGFQCAICLGEDAAQTFLYAPCGHRCLCGDCHAHLAQTWKDKCPLCKKQASMVVRVFG